MRRKNKDAAVQLIRCDECGRFSRNPLGEYVRPDGSVGYIDNKGLNGEFDLCDECAANRCPACASSGIVRVTPKGGCGADGWASRCKDCGHQWERFATANDPGKIRRDR